MLHVLNSPWKEEAKIYNCTLNPGIPFVPEAGMAAAGNASITLLGNHDFSAGSGGGTAHNSKGAAISAGSG